MFLSVKFLFKVRHSHSIGFFPHRDSRDVDEPFSCLRPQSFRRAAVPKTNVVLREHADADTCLPPLPRICRGDTFFLCLLVFLFLVFLSLVYLVVLCVPPRPLFVSSAPVPTCHLLSLSSLPSTVRLAKIIPRLYHISLFEQCRSLDPHFVAVSSRYLPLSTVPERACTTSLASFT